MNKISMNFAIIIGILVTMVIVSAIVGFFIPKVITILFFTIAALYVLFALGCLWYIVYTVIKYMRE